MERVALTPNAQRVLEARYLQRNADGKVSEIPAELFKRVAKAVAQAEPLFESPQNVGFWEERFEGLLSSLDFLPNSPALMNAGRPRGQLSACFVLPLEDSMEGIFETLKQAALVQQTGGGTGFSFSHLRPRGDVVQSTGGEASGPVSFMNIFDSATEHIKQGGKRRGANMGILRVDHPDILEFINAKKRPQGFRNFNISVGISNAFFDAVRDQGLYDLIHPRTQESVDRIPARKVFDAIVDAAWETGDPGLLFLDTINKLNPLPSLGNFEATNPCGEIPLLPNESCNLGSINLAHHVQRSKSSTTVDWKKLRRTAETAVRFLDNLIEVNHYPTSRIAHMSRGSRKIGLGVMGFAEMLIEMGVSYDSPEAISIGEQVMMCISKAARNASNELAHERGVFPNWEQSIYKSQRVALRNATCTAIAPTGTISIIGGTTPGIEPLFALAFRRSHSLGGDPLYEVSPLFLNYCHKWKIEPETILVELKKHGKLGKNSHLPGSFKQLFVTALDVSPEQHLQIQAAFQRHVDNSVSKTINLPEEAARKEVAQIYWRAWELGLKGITVFRYGCKGNQVMDLDIDTEIIENLLPTHCHPCR